MLVSLGAGCSAAPESTPTSNPVLAVLGGSEVRLEQFLDAAAARTERGQYPRSGSGFEEFRDRLILDLAFQSILIEEASRRGLKVDDSDIEAARLTLLAEFEEAVQLDEVLVEQFGTLARWREGVRRRLIADMAEQALRAELYEGLRFEPHEIAEARVQFRDELVRSPRFRAVQFFSPDESSLEPVLEKLNEGTELESLVATHGGVEMGWMSAEQAPELVSRSLEDLAVGKHTSIERSALGFHVFVLTGREPAARLIGDAEAAAIDRLLKGAAVDKFIRDWLAQRAEALQLTLHEGNVAQLRCCRLGAPYWGAAQRETP